MLNQYLVVEPSHSLPEIAVTVQKLVNMLPSHSLPEMMVIVQKLLDLRTRHDLADTVVIDHQQLVVEAVTIWLKGWSQYRKWSNSCLVTLYQKWWSWFRSRSAIQRDTDKKIVHCSKAYLLHTATLSDSQDGHGLTASGRRTMSICQKW